MRTVAVLLIATQLGAAAPVRTWLTATLTETHREERVRERKAFMLGPANAQPPERIVRVQSYTLDAVDRIIICSHPLSLTKGERIDIQVGAPVQYSRISNSQIVIQDAKGKEHKLTIEQETMKAPRQ